MCTVIILCPPRRRSDQKTMEAKAVTKTKPPVLRGHKAGILHKATTTINNYFQDGTRRLKFRHRHVHTAIEAAVTFYAGMRCVVDITNDTLVITGVHPVAPGMPPKILSVKLMEFDYLGIVSIFKHTRVKLKPYDAIDTSTPNVLRISYTEPDT
jgi:hypothetical protein